jgi:hypothetical protein
MAEKASRHRTRVEIDVDDIAEHHAGMSLVAKDIADRRRDRALREDPGRDLVNERLEQVVRVAIYDRDCDGFAPEPLRGEQPSEARAHDDDAVSARLCSDAQCGGRMARPSGLPAEPGSALVSGA